MFAFLFLLCPRGLDDLGVHVRLDLSIDAISGVLLRKFAILRRVFTPLLQQSFEKGDVTLGEIDVQVLSRLAQRRTLTGHFWPSSLSPGRDSHSPHLAHRLCALCRSHHERQRIGLSPQDWELYTRGNDLRYREHSSVFSQFLLWRGFSPLHFSILLGSREQFRLAINLDGSNHFLIFAHLQIPLERRLDA